MTPQEALVSAGYPPDQPCKELPDGRIAWVTRLMFTYAICVASQEIVATGYDDRWCYKTRADAIEALEDWTTEPEPTGWHRNPKTGRRRPDGDPAKEYINP